MIRTNKARTAGWSLYFASSDGRGISVIIYSTLTRTELQCTLRDIAVAFSACNFKQGNRPVWEETSPDWRVSLWCGCTPASPHTWTSENTGNSSQQNPFIHFFSLQTSTLQHSPLLCVVHHPAVNSAALVDVYTNLLLAWYLQWCSERVWITDKAAHTELKSSCVFRGWLLDLHS